MIQDNTKWMDQAFQDLKNQEIDEFTGIKKRPKKLSSSIQMVCREPTKQPQLLKCLMNGQKRAKGLFIVFHQNFCVQKLNQGIKQIALC